MRFFDSKDAERCCPEKTIVLALEVRTDPV